MLGLILLHWINSRSGRKQIEAKAAELGISDPALKAQLGAKTRAGKQLDISLEELRASWRDRLSSAEERTIQRIGKSAQQWL